jgi:hypothetical protein
VIAQWLWSLSIAFAILWAVGSLLVAAFRPWDHFTGRDWWIAWVLVFLWWGVFACMAYELAREHFEPDDDDGG